MMQPYPLLILFLQRGGRVVGHGKIMQEKILLGDSDFNLFFSQFLHHVLRLETPLLSVAFKFKTHSDDRNFREITVVIKVNECM